MLKFVSRPKTLAAWGFSIFLHGVLVVLLILTSSAQHPQPDRQRTTPTSYLDQPQKKLDLDPIITDLQVEPVKLAPPPDQIDPLPMANTDLDIPQRSEGPRAVIASPQGAMEFAVAAAGGLASRVCGTTARGQNVCFVVDHSASMLVAMTYVRNELSRAVNSLSPGQFFRIVLYAGDRPMPIPRSEMARATRSEKNNVLRQVTGATASTAHSPEDAVQSVITAVQTAFASRTPSGEGPSIIYLLTDGQYDRLSLHDAIDKMQTQHPAKIPINIVACGGVDHEELHTLAKVNHGQYRYISPRELDEAILDRMDE
jgi:hypothetical protein